jgi:uncharacterized protein with HEPN domain
MEQLTDIQKLQWIIKNIPYYMKDNFTNSLFESDVSEKFLTSWIHCIEIEIIPEYKKAIEDSIKSIEEDKEEGLSWKQILKMREEINKC